MRTNADMRYYVIASLNLPCQLIIQPSAVICPADDISAARVIIVADS